MTPQSFREELKRFDPRMDIVLNKSKGQWDIIGQDGRNRKYIAKQVPFGMLGKWVICDMYDSSPMKQGGAKALNRKIDEGIERNEKQQEKDFHNQLEGIHDDAYIKMKYQAGERFSFAGVGDKHEGTFFVNDRRRNIESGIGAGEN